MESALIKTGNLETELATHLQGKEKQSVVNQTNQLLKQIGSSKRIVNPAKGMSKNLSEISLSEIRDSVAKLFEGLTEKPDENKKAQALDKKSFVYYKLLRELALYKRKLSQTERDMFWATLRFNIEKKNDLRIRKKLLLQNIAITERRLENKSFSYTRVIEHARAFEDRFF